MGNRKGVKWRRRYGKCAKNPLGVFENLDNCIQEICVDGKHYSQCYNKRGHGPMKEYCKYHARMVEGRELWKVIPHSWWRPPLNRIYFEDE